MDQIQMTANEAQAPATHVQGLEKSYKELHVLRGVDFDIARGTIFALLGSNGAGKTTIVNVLSTLLKADVTANSADDKALLQRFGLFGPPGTLFFDAKGQELAKLRVVGFVAAREFEQTLQAAGL